MRRPGIYFLINLANGKLYVGQTINLHTRLAGHINSLKRGTHCNRFLQFAFNKHGEDSFLPYIAETCASDLLTDREQYWIDFFGDNRIYNLAPSAGSCLGVKHTPEFCKKMSDRKKGVPQPDHVRAAVSAANRVRKISEETRMKLAEASRQRVCTDETRAKLSAANKGRPLSQEQKNKLSITRSRVLCAFGKAATIKEWSEDTGIPATTISRRLYYGFSVEEAVSRPAKNNKRRKAMAGGAFHANPREYAA